MACDFVGRALRSGTLVALVVCGGYVASICGQQGVQGPVFTSSVDVARLNVRVFDRNHRPLPGLKAEDFEISVDGVKQPIVALSELRPDAAAAPSHAFPTVQADVASNAVAHSDARVWALIMDDCTLPTGYPSLVQAGKAIARQIVDGLADGDRAAIIFTWQGQRAQDFTTDRARLKSAIDTYKPGPWPTTLCHSGETIKRVWTFLGELGNPRAALVFIGRGPWVYNNPKRAEPDVATLTQVPFYGFNVAGLWNTLAPPSVRLDPAYVWSSVEPGNRYLMTLANDSGGLAVVNNNAPEREVSRVFQNASDVYLIGYRPTYPIGDGRFRRVQITVDVPHATVEPNDRMFRSEVPRDVRATPWVSLANALSGVLPETGASLRVSALPFRAIASSKGGPSEVIVALGVDLPAATTVSGKGTVRLSAVVFDGEGQTQISSSQQEARVPLNSSAPTTYDFLSTQELKPGRYQLRFAMENDDTGVVGSVYSDVTVPDFEKEPLSLSGLVIAASPGPIAAPKEAISGLLPIIPTTAREFTSADTVTAFLRIYEGTKSTPASVSVTTSIEDDQNKVIQRASEQVAASAFSATQSVDWQRRIPVSSLPAGRYLYEVDVSTAERHASRTVIFAVARKSSS